jgi:hypothetical protein
MKMRSSIVAAGAAAFILALSPGARAQDEAWGPGISIDGYIAPVWDAAVTNVTNPQSQNRLRGLVGLSALANFGPCAAGGVVEGSPGVLGNGRLTVGAVAGWQPRVGTHWFQVLGEAGAERFTDVGGDLFSTTTPHEIWLSYLGARVGVSETFGRGGHFVLGGWLFVRKDLDEATATNNGAGLFSSGPATDYRVGGTSAGATLRFGFRFDRRRPAGDDQPPEVAVAAN